MKRQYVAEKSNFGAEVAKIMPQFLREFASSQYKNIFSKIPLTVPQIIILDFLAERGFCKMNQLARALNFTMSAVTVIIDKMIQLKLVKRERSSQDRRVVNVIILHKGRETVKKVRDTRCNFLNELFSTLTQEDKNEYLRILKKVFKNLRQGQ